MEILQQGLVMVLGVLLGLALSWALLVGVLSVVFRRQA
jgi:hypothetical protein